VLELRTGWNAQAAAGFTGAATITSRLPGPRQFSADKIFFLLMGV
jgi:hypothetical protein